MKRSVRLLLALLAGIVLQTSLLAAGAAASSASHGSSCAFESALLDPSAPVTRDLLPDADSLFNGASPSTFSPCAHAYASGTILQALLHACPSNHAPVPSRPVYLTTLRLRI